VENLVTAKNFWRGKRVFVTGHTGFKGSWLCLWLQQWGAEVTGYALAPTTEPNLFTTARVADGMTSHLADIRDLKRLALAMRDAAPEIVFHMAAQSLVRESYHHPVDTYATNVMGTVNLFEAVRVTPSVRAVVNVTSDKCYENREREAGYREDEPMGGYDPYSNSKGCAELVTAAYRNSFFNVDHRVMLGSARAGNVIGGGDWAADRLIPDILRAIAKNIPVPIRNPHAIRPWQHVLEPLSGYLSLAEHLFTRGQEFAEAWNLGPAESDARPVQWVVEHMIKLWGENARYELDAHPHPHEAHYLKLNCTKAAERMAWHPRWSLDVALQKLVAWHKAHANGGDMRAFTLAQIAEYSAN